jgi:hypothetical protein
VRPHGIPKPILDLSGLGVAGGAIDIPGDQHGPWFAQTFLLAGAEGQGVVKLVVLDQLIRFGNSGRKLKSPRFFGFCFQLGNLGLRSG